MRRILRRRIENYKKSHPEILFLLRLLFPMWLSNAGNGDGGNVPAKQKSMAKEIAENLLGGYANETGRLYES